MSGPDLKTQATQYVTQSATDHPIGGAFAVAGVGTVAGAIVGLGLAGGVVWTAGVCSGGGLTYLAGAQIAKRFPVHETAIKRAAAVAAVFASVVAGAAALMAFAKIAQLGSLTVTAAGISSASAATVAVGLIAAGVAVIYVANKVKAAAEDFFAKRRSPVVVSAAAASASPAVQAAIPIAQPIKGAGASASASAAPAKGRAASEADGKLLGSSPTNSVGSAGSDIR